MDRSIYMNSLKGDVLKRYIEKVEICENVDPYTILMSEGSRESKDFSKVAYYDICHYLMHSTSTYSKEEMQAYRSLDAYKYFENGWVKDLFLKKIANVKTIVVGRVYHSFRLNERPLEVWVVCQNDGPILAAHCNCIAGLGEVCSHVGSVLYAIESISRCLDEKVKTDVLCEWNKPHIGEGIVRVQKIKDMQFFDKENEMLPSSSKLKGLVPFRSDEVKSILQEVMDKTNLTPALAVLTPGLNTNFVTEPEVTLEITDEEYVRACSLYLSSMLYKDEYKNLPLDQLIQLGENIELKYTDDDCIFIETVTRKQSESWFWERLRMGRITASIFKQVCKTSLENPSMSLLNTICWPETTKFSSAATTYGRQNEEKAFNEFCNLMKAHKNFTCEKKGLIINKSFPYFGASPDGMLNCDCCGKKCLEIKCPYSLTKPGAKIENLLGLKDPFLKLIDNKYEFIKIYKKKCVYKPSVHRKSVEN